MIYIKDRSVCPNIENHKHTYTHTSIQSVWADILMWKCQRTKLKWNIFHIRLGSKPICVYVCICVFDVQKKRLLNTNLLTDGDGERKSWRVNRLENDVKEEKNHKYFSYSFHVIRWIIMLIHNELFSAWRMWEMHRHIKNAENKTIQSAKPLTDHLFQTILTNYNNLFVYSSLDVSFLIFEKERRKKFQPKMVSYGMLQKY